MMPDDKKLDILKNIYYNGDGSAYVSDPSYEKYLRDNPKELDRTFQGMTDRTDWVYMPNKTEVEVIGYKPLTLNTYYPGVHPEYDSIKGGRFKYTGHSELIVPRTSGSPVKITATRETPDYNLVTNNCSDATRRALEVVFGQQLNPQLFTTPGDVRDFAIEQGGTQKNARQVVIPMNKERYERIKEYINGISK